MCCAVGECDHCLLNFLVWHTCGYLLDTVLSQAILPAHGCCVDSSSGSLHLITSSSCSIVLLLGLCCCCCLSTNTSPQKHVLLSTRMPVLCIGPVCIPLNVLLPFLLGVAHHYGWLKWVKRWVALSPSQMPGVPAVAFGTDMPCHFSRRLALSIVPL
jgi:hypothetical protein